MPAFNPNERTAPTTISGSRGHEQLNSARVVVDMQDDILLFQPEATPLLTLTGKLRKKREALNPLYSWLEKDEYPRTLTVTAAYDSDDTAISVTAGDDARVYINCVVQNQRTGELILVTAAPTSGSLGTVVRGIGGGQSDGIIGDKLVFVFNANEDGADTPAQRSIQEFNLSNRTQIVRTAFGFTGRDLVVELYGGRDEVTETKWQAIEHKKSIEYLLLFGKQHLITGTHQQSFSDGLDNRIATNRWNIASADLTEDAWISFLEYGMRWGRGGSQNGSGTKYLLGSARWLTQLNAFARDRIRYEPLDESIGFNATSYTSPHGKVMFLHAPILDKYHPERAYLVDMNHGRYVYLRGRDTKLFYDRQGNGIDGKINEYITDCGSQWEFEHAHSALFLS